MVDVIQTDLSCEEFTQALFRAKDISLKDFLCTQKVAPLTEGLISKIEDDLKAIVILPNMMGNTNFSARRKGRTNKSDKGKGPALMQSSSTVPDEHLLRIVPEGTDVTKYVADNAKAGATQPYLILHRGANTFFVTVDSEVIVLPPKTAAIAAFDILFKTYFVMNVEYPESLLFFYNFLETQIYKISTKQYPTVVSFCNLLEQALE